MGQILSAIRIDWIAVRPSRPLSGASTVIRLLTASIVLFCLSACSATGHAAEPVSMFDGKSLEGWRGRADLWSVVDGTIVGRTTAEDPIKKNTFLVWEGDAPADFELRISYWIEGGNSGIQYRSKLIDDQDFVVGGYQADIEVSNKFTGINYEERGRGILAQRGQRVTIAEDGSKKVDVFGNADEIAKAFHADAWNEYRVVAKGNTLQHFINDTLTSEVIDEQSDKAAKEGIIALQLHVGPAMVIRFRNMTIKSL
jgi:hypothetical protein